MKKIRFLREAQIKRGTRAIVRADLDVVTKPGRLEDNFKIYEMLPTMRFLVKKGASIRVISHLGRPHGKVINSLSMKDIALRLGRILGLKMLFVRDPLSREFFKKYDKLPGLIFFENVRFWPGEEKNDTNFAKKIAKWGDIYVNEAFANSHRNYASMSVLARLLPNFAGLHLEKEISFLGKALKGVRRPLVSVLGGAKLETKLPLIEKFLAAGGEVILGGTLANTVLFAGGADVGRSVVDKDLAKDLRRSIVFNPRLHLPLDYWVANGPFGKPRLAAVGDIRPKESVFDIGPVSLKKFGPLLHLAKTIVWNGPVGLAEDIKFSKGTKAIARLIRNSRAFRVIGGSDTVAVLKKYKILRGFDHVSTGGGAMLEFLARKKLPGIEALKR